MRSTFLLRWKVRPIFSVRQTTNSSVVVVITRTLSLNELNRHAIAALIREIGMAGTLRFLGQYTGGSGNYTGEREALLHELNEMSMDELAELAHRIDEQEGV